jgi:hypothetical protein
VDVFNKHHIEVHGFRCPYLSCTDELLTAIPAGIFQYSSNQALRWEVDSIMPEVNSLVVNTIDRFYIPRAAQDTPCVPYKKGPLVEIPVCVPDDLQLFDGYRMPPEAIAALWQRLLEKTHRRGDLFNLMFHPELCASSSDLFLQVIEAAQALQPAVWITRLAEVADWWLEKETFGIEVSKQEKNLDIRFVCSPRATILVHGINLPTEVVGLWDARYSVLKTHSITLPDFPRPFIGVVGQNVPAPTIQFLREQGYFVESGPFADQCSILLDSEILKFLPNPQAILDWIEDSPAPLVRYGRWPLECKSALCISGDLDALTLLDYADRLVAN